MLTGYVLRLDRYFLFFFLRGSCPAVVLPEPLDKPLPSDLFLASEAYLTVPDGTILMCCSLALLLRTRVVDAPSRGRSALFGLEDTGRVGWPSLGPAVAAISC